MTVVVGFVAADGAVMASDSEATESGHTRYDVEKVWTCGGLLCGYTGSGSVKDRLARSIADAVGQTFGDAVILDRYQVANVLQAAAHPVLQHVYTSFVPSAPGQHYGMLAGVLLIIGRDDAGYWILELDGSNTTSFYTDAGFHTVGSGSAAAYVAFALMKGYDMSSRSVSALRLVAYRTVSNCINTIGGSLGVGGYVQLWSSEVGGSFEKSEGEALASVHNGVEQWTTIERESLDRVTAGVAAVDEPGADEVGLPADLGSDAAAPGAAEAEAAGDEPGPPPNSGAAS